MKARGRKEKREKGEKEECKEIVSTRKYLARSKRKSSLISF